MIVRVQKGMPLACTLYHIHIVRLGWSDPPGLRKGLSSSLLLLTVGGSRSIAMDVSYRWPPPALACYGLELEAAKARVGAKGCKRTASACP